MTTYHPWTARLADVSKRTPIEHRASDLVWAIEKMGGSPLLTAAQMHAQYALQSLGAWTDAGEPGKNPTCYDPNSGDEHHERYIPKPHPITYTDDSIYLPYQKRLVDEKTDLDTKIEALTIFISSNLTYPQLPIIEQELMMKQLETMTRYSSILKMRIKRFNPVT